jgi:FAD:protein FMN transferase
VSPGPRLTHEAMACTFGVQFSGVGARYAQQAAWAAFDEVDRLELLLSRFVGHSDIARLNAAQTGEWVVVSVETLECLHAAAEFHALTAGAFDIAFRTPAELRAAGGPPLAVDDAGRRVALRYAGVVLDLGALGKGYAVDRMVAVLREWRISAALVDSGQSTVYALGRPADDTPWSVGLRLPDTPDEVWERVELCDAALGGSGQVLHGPHIVDPRQSRPVPTDRAAWAIAPTAAAADALSTAFMVLEPEQIEQVCAAQRGVSAIVVRGTIRRYTKPSPS